MLSGEKVVKYPDQNEAPSEIIIIHSMTSLNCSMQSNFVCSASNFVSNASKVISLAEVCANINKTVSNEQLGLQSLTFHNSTDDTSFNHETPPIDTESANVTNSSSSQELYPQALNDTWNYNQNTSLITSW